MSERVKAYHKLLQFVLLTHRSDINVARLRVFIERMATKDPLLTKFSIDDDHVLFFPKGVGLKGGPREEEVLSSASLVLACMFKAMAMFVGPKRATNDIVASVEEYLERHPDIKELDLQRYLPRKTEESETARPATGGGEEGEGEAGYLEVGERPPGTVPVYDQKAMRWKYVDPSEVEDDDGGITPVYEDGAIIRKAGKKAATSAVPLRPVRRPPPIPVDEGKVETYTWLDEPMRVGGSILLEGTADVKDVLGCSFLLEGIEKGEPAIAVLGVPQSAFWDQMTRLGLKPEQRSLVWVVDWHSFKERPVPDVHREGRTFVVTKDPRFMGSALTSILSELKGSSKKRAFVSIISPALAFMDMETVFNFAQISKLKFKRGGVSSLFTMEVGGASDDVRGQFTELFDTLMVIREVTRGPTAISMRVHLVDRATADVKVKDITIAQEEPLAAMTVPTSIDKIPSTEAMGQARPAMAKAAVVARPHAAAGAAVPTPLEKFLKSKDRDYDREIFNIRIEHWQREGYDVAQLEKVLESDMDTVERVFAAFRDGVKRLRTIERELAVLDLTGVDDEVTAVRAILYDVTRLEEAETLFTKIREKVSTKGFPKGTEALGADAEEPARPMVTTLALPIMEGGGTATVPGSRGWEDVAAEIFDMALQGYSPDVLETIDFHGQEMKVLKDLVENLRVRVSVLKALDAVIASLRGKVPGRDLDPLAARTKDVFGVVSLREEVGRLCDRFGVAKPPGMDIEISDLNPNALGVPVITTRPAPAVEKIPKRPFVAPKAPPKVEKSGAVLDLSDEDVRKLKDSWATVKRALLKDGDKEEVRGDEAAKMVRVVKKVVKRKVVEGEKKNDDEGRENKKKDDDGEG